MTVVDELLGLALPRLVGFVLALARITGLMLVAPVFGSRAIPPQVRAALVFFLAVAMLPALGGGGAAAAAAGGGVLLCGLLVLEVGLGFMIGLAAQFIFGGVQMAGQLAGIQMGLGLANLFDPQTQEHITALAQWLNLMALLAFLALDGHHQLVRALAHSFTLLPLAGGIPASGGFEMMLTLAGGIFVIALKIAAPVLVLILLVNGTMGVLAKLIPQVNVFIVGFPLNVGAGLFVLAAALPFTLQLLAVAFGDLPTVLAAVMRALG